ncbi:MOSC domain-containing protein [Tropicimonas sp. S265A]|uniref:MOSC domain-containing protein n=1 Tax=Tropicimonas sp. S265A TaxID=3415134 RepID=UPI003C7A51EE
MAVPLKDLIGRVAQPGHLVWIGLRSARRAPVDVVTGARLTGGGLEGDRARAGKRAVSLFQVEHLAAIASYLGYPDPIDPRLLRRNLGIGGLNLLSLKGREIAIGSQAVLRITGPCAPCSRMEEAFGHGGYAAVRGHGGMTAEVVQSGAIALNDSVIVLPE